ncbi:hypothetical protein [Amycolatopsis cihanbeyliensis]|uniref:Uncharacterized protein n=1 Tax=Amycolatopsis cihanbeyliensis TaxID=1128664 RepID=A0A542CTU5_AMYCI|nr:hypothetical protein [Amycolatopsis cihanbeyliensis]TQI94243.1 hypothetical protein FB471_6403 [Amycolatopsis cihanbeyliensis]
MSNPAERRQGVHTPRQVRAIAMLTVLGIAMFVVVAVVAEPSWILWVLGGLMLFSAAAFWGSYALDRRRRRSS